MGEGGEKTCMYTLAKIVVEEETNEVLACSLPQSLALKQQHLMTCCKGTVWGGVWGVGWGEV